MTSQRILVTSALPYANGHIHIGHLVEYLQTDIWVRFQKLRGRRCIYICADDTHGTAIMIRARQEGIGEEELIAKMQQAHVADFAGFDIEFDNYGSTNSPETREVCEEIWAALRRPGWSSSRQVTQLYDAEAGTFLADRFVKGTCPKCKSPEPVRRQLRQVRRPLQPDRSDRPGEHAFGQQAGNPRGRPPVRQYRKAARVSRRVDPMRRAPSARGRQLPEGPLPRRAAARLGRFAAGALLRLRDSRQPGQLLVRLVRRPDRLHRLDRQWCKPHGENFDDWWRNDEKTEIHHFIGKDITYFHTLFWPAMLKTAGFSLPAKVHIHGFLTVDGEKMSKSKGTFIRASTYLEHLDPSYLRYYYASKLTPRVDDIDLNFDEFVAKVNADMVGNVVNLASRTAKFAAETGLAATYPDDGGLFAQAAADGEAIAEAYDACDYARADAADSGGRRSGQPVHRATGAVEPAQRPGQTRPTARCLHHRAEPVPPTGRLPGAGAAAAGQADWRIAGRSDHVVGPIAAAAAGHGRWASSRT